MRETAYAKINLALHVRRRREDGYHELETLFAFVDAGDALSAVPAEADLVARALSALPRSQGLAVTLEKNLPVAAGLGGGSADAGALFRMVRDRYGLPDDWRMRATKLGADVPACVESVACIGRGTGTELEPVEDDLAGTPVLLVNPRLPMPTGPVFAGWDGVDRGPLPAGPASQIAREGRNDLVEPAKALSPAISEVILRLRLTGAWKAEMSGSGATCFALYASEEERDVAAATIGAFRPDWWQMAGRLR